MGRLCKQALDCAAVVLTKLSGAIEDGKEEERVELWIFRLEVLINTSNTVKFRPLQKLRSPLRAPPPS